MDHHLLVQAQEALPTTERLVPEQVLVLVVLRH
jgi:hypothetical protein